MNRDQASSARIVAKRICTPRESDPNMAIIYILLANAIFWPAVIAAILHFLARIP